jgi:hypothetical protein
MNRSAIDKEFEKLIRERGIHNKLNVSSGLIRTYRYNLAKGIAISTDQKLDLLKKSGWKDNEEVFKRNDLVSLLNFWKRTSQSARDKGPEYVIEKWEAVRGARN